MNGAIVLAHGLFGFGDLLPGFQPINYFNGVADLFKGTKVFAPQVDPVGTIEVRGNALADAIRDEPDLGKPLHIIAHSMGGLDARHVITHRTDVSPRIATLVTIGTPHNGSAVADALVKRSHPLVSALVQLFPKKLADELGAIENLTTEFCKNFNKTTPDLLGKVRYINVAGDASRGSSELPFFKLAARIAGFTGVNDGVVAKNSALRDGNEHLDDWPVDHLGEIGWSTSTVGPGRTQQAVDQHRQRYQAIFDLL
jgi:triacylglycerol lipase